MMKLSSSSSSSSSSRSRSVSSCSAPTVVAVPLLMVALVIVALSRVESTRIIPPKQLQYRRTAATADATVEHNDLRNDDSADTLTKTTSAATRTSAPAAVPTTATAPPTAKPNQGVDVTKSPFKIIIDGGSTGSRLHIFEFVEVPINDDESDSTKSSDEQNTASNTNATSTKTVVQCLRRGSSRADVPLSSFGRLSSEMETHQPLNPTHVANHLIPLFEYAATIIPSQYYDTTSVFYQATAGMRLLDVSEQDAVYDALYKGLQQDDRFVFQHGLERRNIATLSGELEGYFGAVAANFLQGVIDTELRLLSSNSDSDNAKDIPTVVTPHPSEGVVGALDMGGASSQIVYMADPTTMNVEPVNDDTCPKTVDNDNDDDNSEKTCQSSSEPPRISDEHFFSTSYLSYGVDQFRERMWSHLVTERIQEEDEYPDSCLSKFIQNPCANVGYTVEWEGYTLMGTGNTDECIRQTQRLIPHPEIPQNDIYDDDNNYENSRSPKRNVVGGIEHPPIRGKFLAMSLYFFTLDSLRVFSEHEGLHLAWPTPSLDELHDALDGLCSRDWHSDMAMQEGVHQFSRPAVLPHRCIESVYLVTLLKDGFGFDPSSRDITFTFKVDGDEVEWTLGMALAMNAEEVADEARGRNNETQDGTGLSHHHMESIDEQFSIQAAAHPYLYFGVTSSPTYCC